MDGAGTEALPARQGVPDTLESLDLELFDTWADACCRLDKHGCRQCYLHFSCFEQINSVLSFTEHLLSGTVPGAKHVILLMELRKHCHCHIQRDETQVCGILNL